MSLQSLASHRKTGPTQESGRLRWLVSYADMVTLLFALFLVLYALAQTHPERISRLAGALHPISGPQLNAEPPRAPAPTPTNLLAGIFLPCLADIPQSPLPLGNPKERLRNELEKSLAGGLLGVAQVHSEKRGVVVALLDSPLLFPSGKAQLSPAAGICCGACCPSL